MPVPTIIQTTTTGVQLGWLPGGKPAPDFRVRFKQPSPRARWRQPSHIYLLVDVISKREHNAVLTDQLINHILAMCGSVSSITSFPPTLQHFNPAHVSPFIALNSYGELDVETLLKLQELIVIQEKVNCPTPRLPMAAYVRLLLNDIYGAVGLAQFKGRR